VAHWLSTPWPDVWEMDVLDFAEAAEAAAELARTLAPTMRGGGG
jgi:hypothetical protein